MRGNTITIEMAEKRGKMAKTIPLYQYDYGQKLIITNLELPTAYEVHFSNEMKGESVLEIGDSTGVDIPDSLLETGKNIYLWLFLHDGETDGETEYSGVIPVIKRAERSEDEPDPEQQGAITTAIAALNSAVEATAADVTSTGANALKAEGYAAGTQNGEAVSSGTYYQNNAKYYSEQAAASATEAAGIIDDTAGSGSANKTWSADKLTTEKSSLLSEIDTMTVEEKLLRDSLPGTSTTVTMDSNGNPTSIVHSADGSTVRTDAFVWSDGSVTETRTASEKYITITTNLTTLAQTISEVQEVA